MEESQNNDDTHAWLDGLSTFPTGPDNLDFPGGRNWDPISQGNAATVPLWGPLNYQNFCIDEFFDPANFPLQEDMTLNGIQYLPHSGPMLTLPEGPVMPGNELSPTPFSQESLAHESLAFDFNTIGTSQGPESIGFSPHTQSLSPLTMSSLADINGFLSQTLSQSPVTPPAPCSTFSMIPGDNMTGFTPTLTEFTDSAPSFGNLNPRPMIEKKKRQPLRPMPRQGHQTRNQQHTVVQGRLKAKEERRITLPEKCPFCGTGHQYAALLDRHIKSNHPERANLVGLSTSKFPCPEPGCLKEYTRSDHCYRHGIKKHGWPPGKKRK